MEGFIGAALAKKYSFLRQESFLFCFQLLLLLLLALTLFVVVVDDNDISAIYHLIGYSYLALIWSSVRDMRFCGWKDGQGSKEGGVAPSFISCCSREGRGDGGASGILLLQGGMVWCGVLQMVVAV